MGSSRVQFYLIPKLLIEIFFDVKKIILIDIFSHEFIDERPIEFKIGLFGGDP